MVACQNGHTQIVELLLKEQVDPNVQEKVVGMLLWWLVKMVILK